MRHGTLLSAFTLSLSLCSCVLDDRSLQVSLAPATHPLGTDSGTDGAPSEIVPTEAAPPVLADCPDLDQDGVPDCQQTLVQNPSFQVDDSGWLVEQNVAAAWSQSDAQAHADSGSLRIESTLVSDLSGLTTVGVHQCLTVTQAGYEAYAELLVPGSQRTVGTAGIELDFFASADCSGDTLDERASDTTGVADTWQLLSLQVDTPEGSRSISVRLMTAKPFVAAPFAALFDDVLVKAPAQK
ncbi:MAG TPA: hypothetical protein VK745_08270 [Polyangiaceae bacterium]|nr:hypothetical protein [Polyangiaceae bacterium]